MKAWLIGILLALGVAGLVLAVWLLPPMVVTMDGVGSRSTRAERLTAIAGARQAMLWAAGGLIAIVTLAFTFRRDRVARQSAELERDANFTSRYTEAIAQVGDDSTAIRLGGVYALERIAKDSLRDRQTILDVLAAYIRDKSPYDRLSGDLPADIEAAITVLGRITQMSPPEHPIYLGFASLYNGDLTGADLAGATLHQSIMIGAKLEGANLGGARMHATKLDGAFLRRANLRGASLYKASLSSADLRDVDFRGARLEDAQLHAAKLDGADLRDADLRGAFVPLEELVNVHVSSKTTNPIDSRSASIINMQDIASQLANPPTFGDP